YLIKSADGLVARFDRGAPEPLVRYLELYTRWVGQRTARRNDGLGPRLIRKWIFQLLLNTALVTGIFLFAALVDRGQVKWFPQLPVGKKLWGALLWLGATVVCLPLFIATVRKLQALGMLVADLSVSEAVAGERTQRIRALVARVVFWGGVLVLGLMV